MMVRRPEWFAPKRYGLGTGLPIAWQGWVLLAAFAVAGFYLTHHFQDRPGLLAAWLIPVSALFVGVAMWSTRGGWRWRWGEDE